MRRAVGEWDGRPETANVARALGRLLEALERHQSETGKALAADAARLRAMGGAVEALSSTLSDFPGRRRDPRR